jgi:hypothetical protein
MRLPEEVGCVHELHALGLTSRQIATETGIPRGTILKWIRDKRPVADVCADCGREPHRFDLLPPEEYAYLLGMYLGDGSIAKLTKRVWALRIYQDTRYPGIIDETVAAMLAVMPQNSVSVSPKEPGANCVVIVSSSRAWPCYFPQVGPGMKHTRKIELTAWQWAYVWQQPEFFLRGLIHSDGCRVTNKVWHGKYTYPRYFFSNRSEDIQQLFRDACDLVGVEYRNNNRWNISVARRASVARLDEFVGPKR